MRTPTEQQLASPHYPTANAAWAAHYLGASLWAEMSGATWMDYLAREANAYARATFNISLSLEHDPKEFAPTLPQLVDSLLALQNAFPPIDTSEEHYSVRTANGQRWACYLYAPMAQLVAKREGMTVSIVKNCDCPHGY